MEEFKSKLILDTDVPIMRNGYTRYNFIRDIVMAKASTNDLFKVAMDASKTYNYILEECEKDNAQM